MAKRNKRQSLADVRMSIQTDMAEFKRLRDIQKEEGHEERAENYQGRVIGLTIALDYLTGKKA